MVFFPPPPDAANPCLRKADTLRPGQPPLLLFVFVFNLIFQSVAWGYQIPAKTGAASSPQESRKGVEATDAERRRETFQIVWQTVKDQHFDPTFGGLNWDAVRAEFAPRVAKTQSDRELHWLLQEMLNRLKQSHFAVIPPELIPTLAPAEAASEDSPDSTEPDDPLAEELPEDPLSNGLHVTEQLSHGIGVDLRIINGAAVISRVDPLSTGERAGLRPGFVIRSVNGYRLSAILRTMSLASVYQPMLKHQLPTEIVVGYLNGAPGTYARISYLDSRNILRRVNVKRERLKGEMSPALPSLPPQFVEFESKRLRHGIGYIRFNVFAVPVMDKFCAALRSMSDAPGIVIDLRGNRGGILSMLYGMGGLLATSHISFGEMKTRAGQIPFTTFPQRKPYTGQLVVLIDRMSLSASEILASGLQESGRAIVIGEQSGGSTLASVAKELPTGAILQYAFADFTSSYGRRIEGHGVKPDIPVKLDRRSLLSGRDPQLEAALNAISPQPTRAVISEDASTQANTQANTAADTEAGARQSAGPAPSPDAAREKAASDAKAANPTAAEIADNQLIEGILEKYVQAIGGRAAVEKISSRISKGTINGSFSGIPINGTVEIIEKSPNKTLTLITFASTGAIRKAFTGAYGYEQISLIGFRELKGDELASLRAASDMHWNINLRRLYPNMVLKEKEKIGDVEVYVIEATPAEGWPSRFYFAADTGLLLRKDESYFEDYRKVDGIMLPFAIRSGSSLITLTGVTHNAAVDDAAFLEQKDCFTQ